MIHVFVDSFFFNKNLTDTLIDSPDRGGHLKHYVNKISVLSSKQLEVRRLSRPVNNIL